MSTAGWQRRAPATVEDRGRGSMRALREFHSPEEIKRAAMSETNKAFDRYMGKDTDADMRSIYRKSARVIPFGQGGKELVREKAI